MSRQDEVLEQLKGVVEPGHGRDIVSLGLVRDLLADGEGRVSFQVDLPTPAGPARDRVQEDCERAVRKLPWVTEVNVLLGAPPRRGPPPGGAGPQRPPLARQAEGLRDVRTILAVSSCKGGVGKSTVAVNLAYTIAGTGASVGIFDADVYGPSLPTLVAPADTELYLRGDLIEPLEFGGVKLMSFGFVPKAPGSDAAIMRGPMVTQVINELLTKSAWGRLDYLVLDLPPGTGDIQLTLTQIVPITAALIVTTPQQLSFVDVVKGIQMFDKVKVPTIGVVENMSYFDCPSCGARHHPFGQGARRKLVEQFGMSNSFEIPMLPDISRLSDSGRPVVVAEPAGPAAAAYRAIAEATLRELQRLGEGAPGKPRLSYSPAQGIAVTLPDGREGRIRPADLRRRCRCALCVEEFSGRQVLDPAAVPEDVYPTGMQPMGNYAEAVVWSDGHSSSIYPYEVILELAGLKATT
jgi:Mrp family chromosome partitioning ATPase